METEGAQLGDKRQGRVRRQTDRDNEKKGNGSRQETGGLGRRAASCSEGLAS